VENTERALRGSLGLAHPTPHRFFHHGQLLTLAEQGDKGISDPVWMPPILRTVAIDGTGVAELAGAIADHRAYLERTGGWLQRERGRLQTELDLLLQDRLLVDFRSRVKNGAYERLLEDVLERRISPFQAVEELIDKDR
jgi:LAO/AO transport system kinase